MEFCGVVVFLLFLFVISLSYLCRLARWFFNSPCLLMLANSKMLSCSVLAVMEKVQQSLAPVFVCFLFFFVGGGG